MRPRPRSAASRARCCPCRRPLASPCRRGRRPTVSATFRRTPSVPSPPALSAGRCRRPDFARASGSARGTNSRSSAARAPARSWRRCVATDLRLARAATGSTSDADADASRATSSNPAFRATYAGRRCRRAIRSPGPRGISPAGSRSCGPDLRSSFPDASFDVVLAISIFTHFTEEEQFAWLAEIRRLLRPGGLLVATTLSPEFAPACPGLTSAELASLSERGFLAVDHGASTFNEKSTFHARAYLEREWSRFSVSSPTRRAASSATRTSRCGRRRGKHHDRPLDDRLAAVPSDDRDTEHVAPRRKVRHRETVAAVAGLVVARIHVRKVRPAAFRCSRRFRFRRRRRRSRARSRFRNRRAPSRRPRNPGPRAGPPPGPGGSRTAAPAA